MKRSTLCVAGVAALAALLGSGCANEVRDASAPTCTSGEDGLLLIAQSVPTADRIPCVTSYLSVWKVGAVEVRDGRSSFSFVANTKRSNGVDVTLQRECLVSGATEVPTDVPGTLRYDRTPESTSGLRMARSYTFDGGCVTYEFHFADRTDPLVTQASLMVGFLPRAELERRLYGPSHGRAGS